MNSMIKEMLKFGRKCFYTGKELQQELENLKKYVRNHDVESAVATIISISTILGKAEMCGRRYERTPQAILKDLIPALHMREFSVAERLVKDLEGMLY